jgi:hypothetical protein
MLKMKMNITTQVSPHLTTPDRAIDYHKPFFVEADAQGGVNCVVKGPGAIDGHTRICVAVHGIFRSPLQQVALLAEAAQKHNFILVAPFFDKKAWRGYQQLKSSKKETRADQALLHSLRRIENLFSLPSRKIWMHGYSGGAQFVHRFTMVHPDKVEAVVLGAAGWYTFPHYSRDYPLGLKMDRQKTLLGIIDPFGFINIRYLVVVGDCDRVRDHSLNQSSAIMASQGKTRIERARNWVNAMRAYISENEGSGSAELLIVEGVGHSFRQLASNPVYRHKIDNFLSGC